MGIDFFIMKSATSLKSKGFALMWKKCCPSALKIWGLCGKGEGPSFCGAVTPFACRCSALNASYLCMYM